MPILVQRLELLEKAKIDAVQRRVKALLIDFESLLAARARAETGAADVKAANGHEQRVRDLHAALLRWDSAAQQLPVVIARLQSLAALHEESASAVSRLATIEKQINDAEQLLATDTQLIAQVSVEFVGFSLVFLISR
jgi:protein-disulfide isomerase